jgi:uncharacterized protein (TIGR00369 family)
MSIVPAIDGVAGMEERCIPMNDLKLAFEPADSGYHERAHAHFRLERFLHTLGVMMSELGPGSCRLSIASSDALNQEHGYFHAGVVAALADASGGYAALTLLPPDKTHVTVEFKVSLLSPSLGDLLSAEAVVLRAGRRLTVCRADVYAEMGDGDPKLCATALATYMAVPSPKGAP